MLFLPWLSGSLAPQVSPATRGAYLNLNLEIRRIDLIRATAEGVAHNLRWLLPYIEVFTGNEIRDISFIGGAARSAAWTQLLADVLDRPVAQMPDPDRAVARGVALFALERQGHLAAPRIDHAARAIHANPEHRTLYDSLQEQFVVAFNSLQPASQP